MSDEDGVPPAEADDETGARTWDAAEVMRRRAEKARAERDDTIGQLRKSMTDDDVLAEFGIDLSEIEK